jgi:hypothetical protein
MKIKTFTCIEIENDPDLWAIDLSKCKKEMKPIIPKYILVSNAYDEMGFIDHIDLTLTDEKPEKIIDGVNGGIADNYKEVGFWIIKN